VTKNLVSITPFFIVKDLHVSIAFYRERLGFQLDFQGPEGDVYYARRAASIVRVGSAPIHDTSAVGP
jgi:catechol 2,3-dioxygenase-like lactoylglutathione lyase family enzyme